LKKKNKLLKPAKQKYIRTKPPSSSGNGIEGFLVVDKVIKPWDRLRLGRGNFLWENIPEQGDVQTGRKAKGFINYKRGKRRPRARVGAGQCSSIDSRRESRLCHMGRKISMGWRIRAIGTRAEEGVEEGKN